MNLKQKAKEITEYFSPKIIGEVNDVYVKLAVIKGDGLPLHNHKNEDELFYILEGELLFEEEGRGSFILKEGDMHIVKRGVNHRVSSRRECRILLIENKETAHTGDVISPITKTIEQQKL